MGGGALASVYVPSSRLKRFEKDKAAVIFIVFSGCDGHWVLGGPLDVVTTFDGAQIGAIVKPMQDQLRRLQVGL